MKVQDFKDRFYQYALNAQDKTGVPALFMLAQAALESGWGEHIPGNMFFGIKAGKNWTGNKQLLTTTEYHLVDNRSYPEVISVHKMPNGKFKYRVKDWFRAYDSPEGSFVDHCELLKSKRYQPAFQYKNDPYKFADAIAGCGYATDPDYAKKIKLIIALLEKIDKTQ